MSQADVIELAPRRERHAGREPWLTKREIAAHIGVSISWVERRMRAGMPYFRDPVHRRVVRFRASEVDRWMGER